MNILIDFDGTVVTHNFPDIGEDIGSVPVLKELINNGHNLILFTMRSNVTNPWASDPDLVLESGQYLTEAIAWFEANDIPLYGIQINPTQASWTTSPKPYGHLIIDDTCLGIPMIYPPNIPEYFNKPITTDRPFVDWVKVREMLIERKFIKI